MEYWSFTLLDAEDRPLRELEEVTGGSYNAVAQSPLGGSAQMTIDHDPDAVPQIDWLSHRVQAVWHEDGASWPVGTWLFTSPTENHSDLGLSFEVELLTKISIPAEDAFDDRYTLPAGSPIIPAVVSILRSTGETRIAVTDSAAVLRDGMTWEAEDSKLAIINDLLKAAGYWSLWCDGSGQYRIEPYVNPADRSPAYSFQHGEASVHRPEWQRTIDMSKVPNVYRVVGEGDEFMAPLVGIAKNEDPASPFSIPSRGRPITMTETGVDAVDQEIFDQLAARGLRDQMAPVSQLDVVHAMLPLDPNDLVEFTPMDGVTRLATVQSMSADFTFDTDINAEWREV